VRSSLKFDPILCDLDGTLVDSAPTITTALHFAFSECGVKLDPEVDLASFVGPPLDRALARIIPEPGTAARVLDVYRREYSRLIDGSVPLMPGADAAITAFSEAGATLAVVTYKPTALAEDVLRGAGLRGLFPLVLGTTPRGPTRTKGELLHKALTALRPHRGTPLYVGDHAEDREAAAENMVAFLPFGPNDWQQIMRRVLAE
jgi:phosphoglycolate phosphatase